MSSRANRMFQQALMEERLEQARRVHKRLHEIGWSDLSKSDRVVMGVLGYLTLEEDETLQSLLDVDLSET